MTPTHRSSGAPTAGHQARPGGTRYIFASPGLASSRCRPVSSNGNHPPAEPGAFESGAAQNGWPRAKGWRFALADFDHRCSRRANSTISQKSEPYPSAPTQNRQLTVTRHDIFGAIRLRQAPTPGRKGQGARVRSPLSPVNGRPDPCPRADVPKAASRPLARRSCQTF